VVSWHPVGILGRPELLRLNMTHLGHERSSDIFENLMKFYPAIFLLMLSIFARAATAAEIIFKDKSGRVLTKKEIQNSSGNFDWEVRSGNPVPEEAKRLHKLGRESGQRGESLAALEYFLKASKVAPNWPYPVYDTAYTYLLMGDFTRAYEFYKQVDVMMPRGFYTSKTAVDSLRQEAAGAFPKGTYLYFLSIEWAGDKAKKIQMLDQLVSKVPQFAPAWKTKASLEEDSEKRLSLLERGLKSNPDVETKGFLLINKALVLNEHGQKAVAIKILGELALNPTSPIDVEALAKQSLAVIVEK